MSVNLMVVGFRAVAHIVTALLVLGSAKMAKTAVLSQRAAVRLSPSPGLTFGFDILSDGRFATADFHNATLALYGANGIRQSVLASAGREYGHLIRPLSLAVSGKEIFLYDIGKYALLRYDSSGNCRLQVRNYDTSPFGTFAVSGGFQFRMGYLADSLAGGNAGCRAFRTDLTGAGAILPLHCYKRPADLAVYDLNNFFGYVDALAGRVYMAFPTELTVRVFDESGTLLRSFEVGGSAPQRAVFDKETDGHRAKAKAWLAWHNRYTVIDGIAVLPTVIAVLVKHPGANPPWRLENYSLTGEPLDSFPVGHGAARDARWLPLRGNHRDTLYLLVLEGSEENPQYRIDRYATRRR